MPQNKSFELTCLKQAFTCVYSDFSLEVFQKQMVGIFKCLSTWVLNHGIQPHKVGSVNLICWFNLVLKNKLNLYVFPFKTPANDEKE